MNRLLLLLLVLVSTSTVYHSSHAYSSILLLSRVYPSRPYTHISPQTLFSQQQTVLRHTISSSTTTTTCLQETKNPNNHDDDHRVVITGLGVISGCGITPTSFFQACCQGQSSIDTITRFDISNYPCKIGSQVPDTLFDPSLYFTNSKNIKSNDRFTHFAVAAAKQALQDSNLGDTPERMIQDIPVERMGVMVGSAFGGVETFEQETLKLASKPDRPKVHKYIYI